MVPFAIHFGKSDHKKLWDKEFFIHPKDASSILNHWWHWLNGNTCLECFYDLWEAWVLKYLVQFEWFMFNSIALWCQGHFKAYVCYFYIIIIFSCLLFIFIFNQEKILKICRKCFLFHTKHSFGFEMTFAIPIQRGSRK